MSTEGVVLGRRGQELESSTHLEEKHVAWRQFGANVGKGLLRMSIVWRNGCQRKFDGCRQRNGCSLGGWDQIAENSISLFVRRSPIVSMDSEFSSLITLRGIII